MRPRRQGRRPSRLGALRRAPQGDGRTEANPLVPPRPLSQGHRARHPFARHDRRAAADLDRLSSALRRPVPDAAQFVESVGAVVAGRDHGRGHGAGDRHPQHRSLGRLDARLHRHDHGRDAGRSLAEASRLRASGDLDAHARGRASARRCARRVPGLCHRPSGHPVLHRHARRTLGLARRRLVGDQRADRGAARTRDFG